MMMKCLIVNYSQKKGHVLKDTLIEIMQMEARREERNEK
jgi:hypothetical protein